MKSHGLQDYANMDKLYVVRNIQRKKTRRNYMKTKEWVINAFVAALYTVLVGAFAFLSFNAVQFRLAEMLNHLAVYNRKYIIGIIGGVFLSNLLFSPMVLMDIIFGTGQSLLALLLMRYLSRYAKTDTTKMIINTILFGLTSFMVAIELVIAFQVPFWYSYFTVALGEVVVMFVGIPVMEYLNKRIRFDDRMENAQ